MNHRIVWVAVACVAALGIWKRAQAGDIVVSAGKMLNNTSRTHTSGLTFDLTLRKEDAFKGLDLTLSLSDTLESDFGDHHGSMQLVSMALHKPFQLGDYELRAGFGEILGLHYAWGDHYNGPMGKELYKAECLLCGQVAQVSVARGHFEITYRHHMTRGNVWTSYDGGMLFVGVRL